MSALPSAWPDGALSCMCMEGVGLVWSFEMCPSSWCTSGELARFFARQIEECDRRGIPVDPRHRGFVAKALKSAFVTDPVLERASHEQHVREQIEVLADELTRYGYKLDRASILANLVPREGRTEGSD